MLTTKTTKIIVRESVKRIANAKGQKMTIEQARELLNTNELAIVLTDRFGHNLPCRSVTEIGKQRTDGSYEIIVKSVGKIYAKLTSLVQA